MNIIKRKKANSASSNLNGRKKNLKRNPNETTATMSGNQKLALVPEGGLEMDLTTGYKPKQNQSIDVRFCTDELIEQTKEVEKKNEKSIEQNNNR